MSWVGVAVAVIGAATSIYSSVEAANAQNEALEAQYYQKERETKVEQEQIAEQTALDKFDVMREALRAKATARVSGAESGVLGNNFSKIMAEQDIDELFELGKLDAKQENLVENTQVALEGMKTTGRVGAAEVSTIGAGLQIAGAGAGAYGAGGGFKKTPKPTTKLQIKTTTPGVGGV